MDDSGRHSEPLPGEEAGSATAPVALQAELAEEMRAADTDELLSWVEQARVEVERPLQLELAVARTTVERASSHRDEERLVLQGLQRQLAKAEPWWRPGSRRRRADLQARIAERQQLLASLGERVRHAEEQVS
jgi:hypothetical protein